jgi:hypothetical protein
MNPLIRMDERIIFPMAAGAGINSTISMSKTRKITASRKKRVEKGIRALFFGSNPHSKGDAFSRSFRERALKEYAMNITIGGRIIANKEVEKGSSIHLG